MDAIVTRVMLHAVALAMAIAVTDSVQAQDKPANVSISENRQARLLERFGDMGIDADEDGALTREEVRSFFAQRHEELNRGHRGRGFGRRGRRGDRDGKMHQLGMALHHLELFSAKSPPADFDLTEHVEADLDGDGQLSETEWRSFAREKRNSILTRLADRQPDVDSDGDGTLDSEELQAVELRFRRHVLETNPEADANGDGTLSRDELATFRVAHLEEQRGRILEQHPEADLDRNGRLSDAEMHQFSEAHGGHDGPGSTGRHGPRRGIRERGRWLLRHPEADLDGDGTLSREERRTFRARRRAED